MNRIHRNDIETMCAVCGRTMLLGERLVTFQRLEGGDARVCELCIDEAEAMGVPMVCGAVVRQMLAITNAKYGASSDFTSIAIAPVGDSTRRAVAGRRLPNVAAWSSLRAA